MQGEVREFEASSTSESLDARVSRWAEVTKDDERIMINRPCSEEIWASSHCHGDVNWRDFGHFCWTT